MHGILTPVMHGTWGACGGAGVPADGSDASTSRGEGSMDGDAGGKLRRDASAGYKLGHPSNPCLWGLEAEEVQEAAAAAMAAQGAGPIGADGAASSATQPSDASRSSASVSPFASSAAQAGG
jgi:hypothetical protein